MRIFKILTLPLAAIMLATPGLGQGNNNPSNMQEGPFALAHGSIGQPRTKDTGNCYVNGHAPQWALDVLIRRGHAAADDANGDTLTLTDPVWKYATCDERTHNVTWQFGNAPPILPKEVPAVQQTSVCINYTEGQSVTVRGQILESATLEEEEGEPPQNYMVILLEKHKALCLKSDPTTEDAKMCF